MNVEELDEQTFANQTVKRLKITKTGRDKHISPADVIQLVNDIQENYDDDEIDAKILVRGENILNDKWTLKGYEGDLMYDEYENYFRGRVSDSWKFSYVSTLYINVKITN